LKIEKVAARDEPRNRDFRQVPKNADAGAARPLGLFSIFNFQFTRPLTPTRA